jgi:GAF domain-containing protein
MALHGRRLDALWKLSNNTALGEDDMSRALLTIAAAALRPGHACSAHLLRLDVDVFHVEETISRGPTAAWLPSNGDSIPVSESLFRDVVRGTGTHACADVRADPSLAALRVGRETDARAFIACTVRAVDTTFVVALVSTQALAEPFDHDDVHFMESLATLLQSRLERRRRRYGPLMNCGPSARGAAGAVPHGSIP